MRINYLHFSTEDLNQEEQQSNDKFFPSLLTEKSMQIIYATSNEEWSKGESYLVVKELMKRVQ